VSYQGEDRVESGNKQENRQVKADIISHFVKRSS
jgi:hypothetical protein